MRSTGAATSLAGLLQRQAEHRADAPALVDVSRSWTYSEIAHRCGQVMQALTSAGVQADDRVGVHCNKGADGFIAMHAVVSLGAVAVPLDPASPAERLRRICQQLDIEVVVSHGPRRSSLEALLGLHPLRSIIGTVIDGTHSVGPEDLDQLSPAAPADVDPDHPSYIITTSGSTGEPKAMVHTHRSALAYANMTLRTYGITAEDRVTDIAPHHFDISTMSLWSVPLAGATNIVVNEAYQRLPASHSQLLQDERATIWYSVPFLLQQLVLRGDLDNRDLSSLRWVHFGGEVIAPEVIAEMMAHCPNAAFGNIFGPAETNQCSLAVFREPPPPDRPLSAGFALDHSDIRVIDPEASSPDAANEVPPGEMGEMWVHTPQLMDGYDNRPELNAAVLQQRDGKRFYRTGNLISIDDRGEITFYGRVDHQVKVRGFRIELEGIELELERLTNDSRFVAEHVVVGVLRAHSGEDELVAGLLGTTDDFDQAAFLESAASVLPSYAVPTRTVRLDTAHFTGSGKLDRRLLRDVTVQSSKGPHHEQR